MRTKIFAAYLPQFHEIPENNKFWGDGYTDWIATKNAKPQFEGHIQPRIPINENYYDLSIPSNIKWQAELAKKYGIDGFNIYHYWFENGKCVLQKPAELILQDRSIDIRYFFSWDNTSWRNGSWTSIYGQQKKNAKNDILLNVDYGTEKDWKQHFDYLLPFFCDERYLRIDEKPVFALMGTTEEKILKKMSLKWNEWAHMNGLKGVFMITGARITMNHVVLDGLFEYQPRLAAWGKREAIEKIAAKYWNIPGSIKNYYYDYERTWRKIIRDARNRKNKNIYFGGVVKFDDTPRRGNRARILTNPSPEVFEKYLKTLYHLCNEQEKEILLLTAWNELGEGATLEPDIVDGYSYLEAVKRVVEEEEIC